MRDGVATADDIPSPGRTASARVGAAQTSIYGLGAVVDGTTSIFLTTYLYFYLTAVCGLEGWMAGVALALPLALDAFVDPLVGSLSDNLKSRLGRRRPFMLASILPIGLGLGLLFSVPTGLTGWGIFAYVMGLTLLLRVGLSLFLVPYAALGAELTSDYVARSALAGARFAITQVGAFVAMFLAYGVFLSSAAGGQLHRAGYAPLAWSSAALIMAAALVSTCGTRMRGLAPAPAHARWSGEALWRELREVLRNRTFLTLSLTLFVFISVYGAILALNLHVWTFFWRLKPESLLFVSVAGIPGVMVGSLLMPWFNRRLEKRTITQTGFVVLAAFQFLPAVLGATGVLPLADAVPLLVAAGPVTGVGAAMAVVGIQSMMADATDEHEFNFGARREALFFAAISFASKASFGMGVLVAGLITWAIRFPSHPGAPGSATAPSWDAARTLALALGPGMSLVIVSLVAMLAPYRLDRARHTAILQALSARRLASAAE